MVVVRGSVSDRPWGATLAAMGLSGQSGQLELTSGEQKFQIAFVNGLVVGATSPMSVDSVARIALSNRLVTPLQAKTYARIDDVEGFASALKLTPQQTQHLKRRVLVQRVARTFAIDIGDYAVDERHTIPLMVGVEVDIRAGIYMGMRMNLSQQRLTRTMHRIGAARFMLAPEAINELGKFEFGDEEQAVLDRLHDGTSLAELEAIHRELDPRMIEALLCTLAVCNAVLQTDVGAPGSTIPPPISDVPVPAGLAPLGQTTMPRAPTPREPVVTRTPTRRDAEVGGRVPTPREPTITPPWGIVEHSIVQTAVPKPVGDDPEITRPATTPRTLTQQASAASRTTTSPGRPPSKRQGDAFRTIPVATRELAELIAKSSPPKNQMKPPGRTFTDPFLEVQPTKMRPPALDLDEIRELIEVGAILLERSVDHFSFLGLSFDAPVEDVRDAYLEFARYLRPEKLTELGIVGAEAENADAVFAQVVIAYTVLTDPDRRRDYVATLDATRTRARR